MAVISDGPGCYARRACRLPLLIWVTRSADCPRNRSSSDGPLTVPAAPHGLKPVAKSHKLANVCYDIRGPVLDKARQMEDEGQKIIKLNIGNIAAFGLEPPDEIVQDMIRNLPHAAGYTDSKGLFAPRKAVVHYCQEKHISGVADRKSVV